jgi:hypothetical protein
MFGGKLTHHSVSHAVGRLKHRIGHAYHTTKHFLGQVDHGVQIAKKVYGAVAPVLDQYGGKQANKHIMKAIGGYEHIRNKVMDTHETVGNNLNQVAGNLKKRVPELGL